MAFNLACRSLCHTQKLNELSGATAFIAFSNVGHNGDARTTYLISKPKVIGESSTLRDQIDILGQFSRFLPGCDVLKVFERRHESNSEFLVAGFELSQGSRLAF